ncbi:MAG: hypothetical protein N2595_00810 [bacterium]|nr:hypothetical protein [bacterium]
MHNATLTHRLSHTAHALLLATLLSSCSYLVYVPMLILVPFMPLIQLAVKLGARYGPLLLMLVEATPTNPHLTPGSIVAGPPDALRRCSLPTLEQQVLTELSSNQNLRAIVFVEIASLTPEWLDQQQRAAYARGLSLRIAFVDSHQPSLSSTTRQLCAAAGIPLTGTPGLGAALAAGVPFTPLLREPCTTAHASLLAATASCL